MKPNALTVLLGEWLCSPWPQTPPPSSEPVVGCQRSGPRLTVFVGGGGFTGPGGMSAMVGLANAAWASTSNG